MRGSRELRGFAPGVLQTLRLPLRNFGPSAALRAGWILHRVPGSHIFGAKPWSLCAGCGELGGKAGGLRSRVV